MSLLAERTYGSRFTDSNIGCQTGKSAGYARRPIYSPSASSVPACKPHRSVISESRLADRKARRAESGQEPSAKRGCSSWITARSDPEQLLEGAPGGRLGLGDGPLFRFVLRL